MLENRGLEIILIAAVVLLLFGARHLPNAARSLGQSLRVLKAETAALRRDPDERPQVHGANGSDR